MTSRSSKKEPYGSFFASSFFSSSDACGPKRERKVEAEDFEMEVKGDTDTSAAPLSRVLRKGASKNRQERDGLRLDILGFLRSAFLTSVAGGSQRRNRYVCGGGERRSEERSMRRPSQRDGLTWDILQFLQATFVYSFVTCVTVGIQKRNRDVCCAATRGSEERSIKKSTTSRRINIRHTPFCAKRLRFFLPHFRHRRLRYDCKVYQKAPSVENQGP
jgi:hypothetical protein